MGRYPPAPLDHDGQPIYLFCEVQRQAEVDGLAHADRSHVRKGSVQSYSGESTVTVAWPGGAEEDVRSGLLVKYEPPEDRGRDGADLAAGRRRARRGDHGRRRR